ncbi:urease accessory protein UreD [Acuticoccus mangrovi]|uniref:Urease accessory protein UreD n=1 Tax=Acuticoccus mangrovi TaxID=2796142 RepID=A0A934IUQ5_9HYPH|nr:urease accessory protein UreD [Acuticoccus mangrovi]
MTVGAIGATHRPQLDLSVTGRGGRTAPVRRIVRYPYSLGPLHEGAAGFVTAPLQSASGGAYGGERIAGIVRAGEAARICVETTAATVVHAARDGPGAVQSMTLDARSESILAYLPRLQILFPGSRFSQEIRVGIDATSLVMVRDGFLAHVPQGSSGTFAAYRNDVALFGPDGSLILRDRSATHGSAMAAPVAGVNGPFAAFGSLYVFAFCEALADRGLHLSVVDLLGAEKGIYCGASPLRGGAGFVVRIAARDGGLLEAALDAAAAHILERIVLEHFDGSR